MMMERFVREMRIENPTEEFPFTLSVVKNTQAIPFDAPVTFFVGENGTGKSTVLEGLAVALGMNAEGGGQNFTFETARTHSPLHEHIRVVRGVKRPKTSYFLRAESFYNLASNLDEIESDPYGGTEYAAYGGKSLHMQSHGESFLALFLHRFGDGGLYLLDEPEAALSPMRQLAVLRVMHELVEGGSQFIIATHSPLLLAFPSARIYSFDGGALQTVRYEDTEHYNVTRYFMLNHEKYLRDLFAE